MGLPEVLIEFKEKATSFIQRSARGIVVLVLKDDTISQTELKAYYSLAEVSAENWTDDNYEMIRLAFVSYPFKVMIVRLPEDAVDYSAALSILSIKQFDYLAIPGILAGDVDVIKSWVVTENGKNHLMRAVLPNVTAADHECIINFTTKGIKAGEKSYTTAAYTARIAGVLAALSLSMSATYHVLDEITEITDHIDPNADIDAGQLILINDGEKVKIGRAVNSLVTLSKKKGKDYQKIKIVETMHMIKKDISSNFKDNYIGKISNGYDNKMVFIATVEAYFEDLVSEGILDPSASNTVDIDVAKHLAIAKLDGEDVSVMDEAAIREYNTGTFVYLDGKCKPLDAMEDLNLGLEI